MKRTLKKMLLLGAAVTTFSIVSLGHVREASADETYYDCYGHLWFQILVDSDGHVYDIEAIGCC